MPHADLVDLVYGFRPILWCSIGIQPMVQSGVGAAEIVSAQTGSSQMYFLEHQRTHFYEVSQTKPCTMESLKPVSLLNKLTIRVRSKPLHLSMQ